MSRSNNYFAFFFFAFFGSIIYGYLFAPPGEIPKTEDYSLIFNKTIPVSGVFIFDTHPSYRIKSSVWVYNHRTEFDASNVNSTRNYLIMYGGEGRTCLVHRGILNDHWAYDTESDTWYFLFVYGTDYVNVTMDSTNFTQPGSRMGSMTFFRDTFSADRDKPEFYLFGGWGFKNNTYELMDDLWYFTFDVYDATVNWEKMDLEQTPTKRYGAISMETDWSNFIIGGYSLNEKTGKEEWNHNDLYVFCKYRRKFYHVTTVQSTNSSLKFPFDTSKPLIYWRQNDYLYFHTLNYNTTEVGCDNCEVYAPYSFFELNITLYPPDIRDDSSSPVFNWTLKQVTRWHEYNQNRNAYDLSESRPTNTFYNHESLFIPSGYYDEKKGDTRLFFFDVFQKKIYMCNRYQAGGFVEFDVYPDSSITNDPFADYSKALEGYNGQVWVVEKDETHNYYAWFQSTPKETEKFSSGLEINSIMIKFSLKFCGGISNKEPNVCNFNTCEEEEVCRCPDLLHISYFPIYDKDTQCYRLMQMYILILGCFFWIVFFVVLILIIILLIGQIGQYNRKKSQFVEFLVKDKDEELQLTNLKVQKAIDLINLKNFQDQLTLKNKLGSGTYSNVYKLNYKNGTYACRILKEEHLDYDKFLDEIKILANLTHRNILKIDKISTDRPYVGYISELGEMSLEEVLKQKYDYNENQENLGMVISSEVEEEEDNEKKILKEEEDDDPLSYEKKIKYLFEVTKGMHYLHSKNILHKDLKWDNVLLKDNTCKIIDFGFSTKESCVLQTNELEGMVGTKYFVAKEVMETKKFEKKSDVFSFGVMAYQMAFDIPTHELEKFVKSVENEVYKFEIPSAESYKKKGIHKWLVDLIEKCMSDEKEERPSFEDLARSFFYHERDICEVVFVEEEEEKKVHSKKQFVSYNKTFGLFDILSAALGFSSSIVCIVMSSIWISMIDNDTIFPNFISLIFILSEILFMWMGFTKLWEYYFSKNDVVVKMDGRISVYMLCAIMFFQVVNFAASSMFMLFFIQSGFMAIGFVSLGLNFILAISTIILLFYHIMKMRLVRENFPGISNKRSGVNDLESQKRQSKFSIYFCCLILVMIFIFFITAFEQIQETKITSFFSRFVFYVMIFSILFDYHTIDQSKFEEVQKIKANVVRVLGMKALDVISIIHACVIIIPIVIYMCAYHTVKIIFVKLDWPDGTQPKSVKIYYKIVLTFYIIFHAWSLFVVAVLILSYILKAILEHKSLEDEDVVRKKKALKNNYLLVFFVCFSCIISFALFLVCQTLVLISRVKALGETFDIGMEVDNT